MRQCPPAKSAICNCSITSCCPTMTLASSRWICVRPATSFSTAFSSVIGGAIEIGSVSTKIFKLRLICSVSHRVKNYVDAKRERNVFRETMKVRVVLALTFPAIAIVCIVCGNDHDSAFVIKDRADMNWPAFFTVVILPGNVIIRIAPTVTQPHALARYLQFFLRPLYVEYAMKDRMIHWYVNEFAVGQNALDLFIKMLPLRFAPEIIGHHEPAVAQIFLENRHFLVFEFQAARLNEINPGIVEQIRIVEVQHTPVVVHVNGSHLVQTIRQIQIAIRKIRDPRAGRQAAVRIAPANNAHRSEERRVGKEC